MRQPGALRESRARTVTPILFHFGMLLRLEHRAQVVVSLPGRGLCGQRAVSGRYFFYAGHWNMYGVAHPSELPA